MVGVSVPDFRAYADAVRDKAELDDLTEVGLAAHEFAALDAMIRETHPRPGDTRTCPDCGRLQHYTGVEAGWCHDALVDTWHCADPRKAGA